MNLTQLLTIIMVSTINYKWYLLMILNIQFILPMLSCMRIGGWKHNNAADGSGPGSFLQSHFEWFYFSLSFLLHCVVNIWLCFICSALYNTFGLLNVESRKKWQAEVQQFRIIRTTEVWIGIWNTFFSILFFSFIGHLTVQFPLFVYCRFMLASNW